MVVLLALLPWILLLVSLPLLLRRRPGIGDYPQPAAAAGAPLVTVVLPTRDDAHRVGACLATLLATSYPRYEVVVVDAGSGDGTREIVQALEARTPGRIRLLQAVPAPSDWPWRAWACWRGFRSGGGDIVLFTDAGTTHESDLLGRAVSALQIERADLLTVYPRVVMDGFWERLVMPHVRLLLSARFPSAVRVNRSRHPGDAVASYPFMLFRRESYARFGGHVVMRDEGGIEDLTLAQAVRRAGQRLFLVHGESHLETRVVRALGEITDSWPGAVPAAIRRSGSERLGPVLPWLLSLAPLTLFVVPPMALMASLLIPGTTLLTSWAAGATALSLAFWLGMYASYRIRPAYAVAFPVGALATSLILVRSTLRDGRTP